MAKNFIHMCRNCHLTMTAPFKVFPLMMCPNRCGRMHWSQTDEVPDDKAVTTVLRTVPDHRGDAIDWPGKARQ